MFKVYSVVRDVNQNNELISALKRLYRADGSLVKEICMFVSL